MEENGSRPFVYFCKHRFEPGVPQVVAAVVSDHHHAISAELVECESYLGQRSLNIIHSNDANNPKRIQVSMSASERTKNSERRRRDPQFLEAYSARGRQIY